MDINSFSVARSFPFLLFPFSTSFFVWFSPFVPCFFPTLLSFSERFHFVHLEHFRSTLWIMTTTGFLGNNDHFTCDNQPVNQSILTRPLQVPVIEQFSGRPSARTFQVPDLSQWARTSSEVWCCTVKSRASQSRFREEVPCQEPRSVSREVHAFIDNTALAVSEAPEDLSSVIAHEKCTGLEWRCVGGFKRTSNLEFVIRYPLVSTARAISESACSP